MPEISRRNRDRARKIGIGMMDTGIKKTVLVMIVSIFIYGNAVRAGEAPAADEPGYEKTPLEQAVDANDLKAAKRLIDSGANVNVESYYRFKPFKYRGYKQSVFRKLVKLDVDTINFEKMTPLHRAVTHNNLELVRLLVSRGARLKAPAHFGGYPLDFALELGYDPIAEYLLRRGADSIFKDRYLNIAVDRGSYTIAGLLLKIGADPNYRYTGSCDSCTALHLAAMKGASDMVRLLLKYRADRSLKNGAGKTPAELTKDKTIREMLK